MDSELVSDLLSYNESANNDLEGERDNRSALHFSFAETFDAKFPYYLSIGMTEEQYWDRDCELVKFYREAENIRRDKFNQEAWLQGMYIYDAIMRVSPILHDFVKKGTKPQPYVEEPYPITQHDIDEIERKKEKAVADKGKRLLEALMSKNNKNFEERK